MKALTGRRILVGGAVAAVTAVGSLAPPAAASADGGRSAFEEAPVGFFYGTFGEDPELALLAGGTIEDFCLDDPDDPFNAQPGTALTRVTEQRDGTLVVRGRASALPIHLYEHDGEISPQGIGGICDGFFDDDPTTVVPEPIASGSGRLRFRDLIDGDRVDVFNSVRGIVVASDGTRYRVRASADLVVDNGVPLGDPADFVELDVRRIGGCR